MGVYYESSGEPCVTASRARTAQVRAGESQRRIEGMLRSGYTMRTKCAISDAFVRDCVFAYCASVAQYVYSPSAEHYFRLRNSTISDERVRDCALSTHSVFRPLRSPIVLPLIYVRPVHVAGSLRNPSFCKMPRHFTKCRHFAK